MSRYNDARQQLQDSAIGPVSHANEVNQYPPADRVKAFDTEGRRLIQIWDQLMVNIGVLYRVFIGRGNYAIDYTSNSLRVGLSRIA